MSPILVVLFFAFLGWSSAPAMAAKDKLKVGDDAPGDYLSGIEWVKELTDDPVNMDGKPLVIEFWATWCGPCIRGIPHLTKVQQKYGSDRMNIIGVTQKDKSQSKSDVERFVNRQGSRMNYWVAWDEKGKAYKDLMTAADRNGIPCAFIIGSEGRIQFIGHPSSREFNEVLDKVVTGRYDAKTFKRAKSRLDAIERARSLKNWDEYYRISKELMAMDRRLFANLYLEHFDVELKDRNDAESAYLKVAMMPVMCKDDPELLSWMAEHIALDPSIPNDKRDMDIAITLITSAREGANAKDPALIASEAKIRLARGETKRAVDLQREAYYQAPTNRKEQFNRTLEDYKAQLKRE
ncbi:MAG: TlpA family protein disulfide reductase, partial [Phycisphaerales bacterium]|nr:TlpA family protein disulfide reductase [Phycisphaerales bacterium]